MKNLTIKKQFSGAIIPTVNILSKRDSKLKEFNFLLENFVKLDILF